MMDKLVCTKCGHEYFFTFDKGDTRIAKCKKCGKEYAIGGIVVSQQPYYPPEPETIIPNTFIGVDLARGNDDSVIYRGTYGGGSCGGGGSSRSWEDNSSSDDSSDNSYSSCDCGSSDCGSSSCD